MHSPAAAAVIAGWEGGIEGGVEGGEKGGWEGGGDGGALGSSHSQQQGPSQLAATTVTTGSNGRCPQPGAAGCGQRLGVLVGPAGGGGQTRTRVCRPEPRRGIAACLSVYLGPHSRRVLVQELFSIADKAGWWLVQGPGLRAAQGVLPSPRRLLPPASQHSWASVHTGLAESSKI